MEAKLMHAVQYDSYGGGTSGLQHTEVPIPSPKTDEVLLKLEATSLSASDWKIQKGVARPLLPCQFPFIPGWLVGLLPLADGTIGTALDVAGEIVKVGKGVQRFKAGDKVVAVLSFLIGGGLAEYAVASQRLTASRPPEVLAAEGAGLPSCGLTAHQAVTQAAGIKLDKTGQLKNVLITGATGGIGHYAVQLAKLGNTHVTATCGARNIEIVKSLGADEVLDYKTPDGAALKSPSGLKYDIVIHCAPTMIPWSIFEPNLSENGKVINLTPGLFAYISYAVKILTFSKKKLVPFFVNPKGDNLDSLVTLMKEGKLKTIIDSKHPLSKAEDAWAKGIDGPCTGKIIVEQ